MNDIKNTAAVAREDDISTSSVLYHIDLDAPTFTQSPITLNEESKDLSEYLMALQRDVEKNEHGREYSFKRTTTELYTALMAFSRKSSVTEVPESGSLAAKLHDIERGVDKKYASLAKGRPADQGVVRRGDFLQMLYRQEGKLIYLAVKVDQQKFLDEIDHKNRNGLPHSKKVYKACKVVFDIGSSLKHLRLAR